MILNKILKIFFPFIHKLKSYSFISYKFLLLILLSLIICPDAYSQKKSRIDFDACSFNGFKLYGKVKFVDSFPDIKIQIVDSFPDLKVKIVDSFPDECGEWMIVDSFPDIKVKIVDSFPDIKVKFVKHFPGKP